MTKKKTDETKPLADAPAEMPAAAPEAAPAPKAKTKAAPEKRTITEWAARLKTAPALVAGALVRAGARADQEMTEKEYQQMLVEFMQKPAFGRRK